jgi:hypothetical protein
VAKSAAGTGRNREQNLRGQDRYISAKKINPGLFVSKQSATGALGRLSVRKPAVFQLATIRMCVRGLLSTLRISVRQWVYLPVERVASITRMERSVMREMGFRITPCRIGLLTMILKPEND